MYVRQSTLQQVLEHRESTARQYALVEHAVALGWPRAQVEVIDEDQGSAVHNSMRSDLLSKPVDRSTRIAA